VNREQVAKGLAAHYTRKLNGPVRANFDDSKRAYCIHGTRLPAHPDLVKQYPNGWEMLDWIKPAQARAIIAGQAKRPSEITTLRLSVRRIAEVANQHGASLTIPEGNRGWNRLAGEICDFIEDSI
jgi:hypothetical protein